MAGKFWCLGWIIRRTPTICANLCRSPSPSCCRKKERKVSYNDPFFPKVGRGRKYDLNTTSTPLSEIEEYDCVLIVTDLAS